MSLKKISELDKSEKLLLLKSIALSEVDRKILTPETLIGFKYQDAFLGLMVAANNKGVNPICLDEAQKAKEFMTKTKTDLK